MTPSDFAEKIRTIAAKIDNSKSPSRSAVASELKTLIASIDGMPSEDKSKLERDMKDSIKKTQEDIGKQMQDLVKKGVSGEDMSKAVGDLGKNLKDLEHKV